MYIPKIYKNENPEEIRAFLKAHAFGIIVTAVAGKSLATHIPLLIDKNKANKEILHGHISKANEQVDHLKNGSEVLCIFNGPHSYVSSSWYDFEEVSTWNYVSVQVRGILRLLDQEALYQSVKKLMDTYEAKQEKPVRLEDLSEATMRQLHGIIGFEIEINSIEAAYKLSQNRDDKNHKAVVAQLQKTQQPQEQQLAKMMLKQRKDKKEL